MSDRQIFQALVVYATAKFKGFKLVHKQNSLLMRVLSRVLFFNKTFMSGYITTIGSTIYWPGDASTSSDWRTLAHELVHVRDKDRALGGMLGFSLAYLFPQSLALLALLAPVVAFWGPYGWLLLLALIAAAPFPAPRRRHYEEKGYTMSLVCAALDGPISQWTKDNIVEQFVGSSYYWMSRDEESTRFWVEATSRLAEAGAFERDLPENSLHRDVLAIARSVRGGAHA